MGGWEGGGESEREREGGKGGARARAKAREGREGGRTRRQQEQVSVIDERVSERGMRPSERARRNCISNKAIVGDSLSSGLLNGATDACMAHYGDERYDKCFVRDGRLQMLRQRRTHNSGM